MSNHLLNVACHSDRFHSNRFPFLQLNAHYAVHNHLLKFLALIKKTTKRVYK